MNFNSFLFSFYFEEECLFQSKIVYNWLQKLYILHCLWEKEDKLSGITFPNNHKIIK